jgi:hypothetical protein
LLLLDGRTDIVPSAGYYLLVRDPLQTIAETYPTILAWQSDAQQVTILPATVPHGERAYFMGDISTFTFSFQLFMFTRSPPINTSRTTIFMQQGPLLADISRVLCMFGYGTVRMALGCWHRPISDLLVYHAPCSYMRQLMLHDEEDEGQEGAYVLHKRECITLYFRDFHHTARIFSILVTVMLVASIIDSEVQFGDSFR